MPADRERISATAAGKICGYSAPTMRKLAAKGKIPGAAFLVNTWRFDQRRLRDWIRRQEAAACRDQATTSTNATGSGTPEFNLNAETYDEAYTRLLKLKR